MRLRRLGIAALAASLALLAPFGHSPPDSVGADAHLLVPNLQALPAANFALEDAGGAVLLRFSTTSWNSGAGPLDLRAQLVDGRHDVYQWFLTLDGAWERGPLVGSFTWHPAHSHFHLEDYAAYRLYRVRDDGGVDTTPVGGAQKTTFCIMDTDRIDHRLPGASKRAVYRTCGDARQGVSVGWGDTYGAALAGQAIDITGLPDGDYELRVTVDPKERITERDDSDNVSAVRVHIDQAAGTVTVVGEDGGRPGQGRGHGPPR